MRTRAALALAGFALITIALVGGPLLVGKAGPGGQQPTATPTASATPAVSPFLSATPVLSTLPPPNPSEILAGARTSAFGRTFYGQAWWAQGTTFWRSTSASSSRGDSPWPGSDTQPPAVFVLDTDHIWSITLGPGTSNPYGGQGPGFDHLKAIVNVTSGVGGTLWHQSAAPGDYPDSMLSLSFVDDLHGFLMCSGGVGQGSSTILRTDDGGATWSVVASLRASATLGGMFTASDQSTLWAGAQGEAVGHGHPLLAVSRDAGRTWSDVKLPGMSGLAGEFDAWLLDAPVFLDANHGFLAVMGGPSGPAVFTTSDAGRTWTRKSAPSGATSVDFLDGQHWFATVGSSVAATSNGGTSWQTTRPDVPMSGRFIRFVFLDTLTGYGLFRPATGGSAGEAAADYVYQTNDGGSSWGLVSNSMYAS